MPKPKKGESHDAYIKRCIPAVVKDGAAKNGSQGKAICESMWRRRSMVNRRYVSLKGAVKIAEISTAKFEGRDHVVVPVIALVGDAVIRPLGSKGWELVPSGVLAAAPSSWDGRPVVSDHPNHGTESANTPENLEKLSFGRVFNARFHDGKLKVEAWLDAARAEVVGAEAMSVIERCRAGEAVDVSIGAYVSLEPIVGTMNGAKFDYMWTALAADHLAMLPVGMEGACSIDMGCGAPRAAQAETEDQVKGLAKIKELIRSLYEAAEEDQEDSTVTSEPRVACACQGEGTSCTCHESDHQPKSVVDQRQSAEVADDGDKTTMEKKELVGRLIANARSPFQEEDRVTLEAMGDEKLTALESAFAEPAKAEEPKATEIEEPETEETEEDAVAKLPLPLRRQLQKAQEREARERKQLITSLARAQDAYDQKALEAKDTEELELLARALKLDREDESDWDYSGRGAAMDSDSGDKVAAIGPNGITKALAARAASR